MLAWFPIILFSKNSLLSESNLKLIYLGFSFKELKKVMDVEIDFTLSFQVTLNSMYIIFRMKLIW